MRHVGKHVVGCVLALALAAGAWADLAWFEWGSPRLQPLGLAELVAWNDCGLRLDAAGWASLADAHRTYLEEWTANEPGAPAVLANFVARLRQLAGDDDRRQATVELIAAVETARRGSMPTDARHAAVRRAIFELTAGSAADLRLLADAVGRIPAAGGRGRPDPIEVAKALEPLGPSLEAAFGRERADRFREAVARAYEVEHGWSATLRHLEAILTRADRLTESQRTAGLDAIRRSRLALAALLVGRPAADSPQGADAQRWEEATVAAGGALCTSLGKAIGPERAASLMSLALCAAGSNEAADELLAVFMDEAAARALAAEPAGPFWQPTRSYGKVLDDPRASGFPPSWDRVLLEACVRSPLAEGEAATIEGLLLAHRERVEGIKAAVVEGREGRGFDPEGATAAYANRMTAEDEQVLESLRAALPSERIDPDGVALVRLARAEMALRPRTTGRAVGGRWIEPRGRERSLAELALGRETGTSTLVGAAAIAELRAVLAPRAVAQTEAIRSDWGEWLKRREAWAAERARWKDEVAKDPAAKDAATAALAVVEEERLAFGFALAARELERQREVVAALVAREGEGSEAAARVAIAVAYGVVEPPFAAVLAGPPLDAVLAGPLPDDVRARAVGAFLQRRTTPVERISGEIAYARELARPQADLAEDGRLARIVRQHWQADELSWHEAVAARAAAWRVLRDGHVPAAESAFQP